MGDQGQLRANVPPQTSVAQCSEHLGYAGLTGALLKEYSLACTHQPLPVISHITSSMKSVPILPTGWTVFFDVLTFGIPIGLSVFPWKMSTYNMQARMPGDICILYLV